MGETAPLGELLGERRLQWVNASSRVILMASIEVGRLVPGHRILSSFETDSRVLYRLKNPLPDYSFSFLYPIMRFICSSLTLMCAITAIQLCLSISLRPLTLVVLVIFFLVVVFLTLTL